MSKCNGIHIGVLYGHLQNDKRDFYIKEYGIEEEVISGECKFHGSPMSPNDIIEIVNKLNGEEFKSKINLIIVKKVSENIKNININKSLYILINENNQKYSI